MPIPNDRKNTKQFQQLEIWNNYKLRIERLTEKLNELTPQISIGFLYKGQPELNDKIKEFRNEKDFFLTSINTFANKKPKKPKKN